MTTRHFLASHGPDSDSDPGRAGGHKFEWFLRLLDYLVFFGLANSGIRVISTVFQELESAERDKIAGGEDLAWSRGDCDFSSCFGTSHGCQHFP